MTQQTESQDGQYDGDGEDGSSSPKPGFFATLRDTGIWRPLLLAIVLVFAGGIKLGMFLQNWGGLGAPPAMPANAAAPPCAPAKDGKGAAQMQTGAAGQPAAAGATQQAAPAAQDSKAPAAQDDKAQQAAKQDAPAKQDEAKQDDAKQAADGKAAKEGDEEEGGGKKKKKKKKVAKDE